MRRSAIILLPGVALVGLALAALAQEPVAKQAPAVPKVAADALCFGGPAKDVSATGRMLPNRHGGWHWERPPFLIAEGKLLWAIDNFIGQVDLATLATSSRQLTRPMILEAMRNGEAIGVEDMHGQAFGGAVFAADLRTGAERTVLAGGVSQRFSLYQFDGPDLYYIRGPYDETSKVGEKKSSFFRLRGARGEPEFLGYEPQGVYNAFRVDRGFVYWNREVASDVFELSRRALTRDSPVTKLAATKDRHLQGLVLANGRVYYLDDGGLFSVPMAGGQPATRHLDFAGPEAGDLVVEGACAYWTTPHAIMRARLDGKGPQAPEIVADDASYQDGAIATDGRFLYWHDQEHGKFVRAGRSASAVPVRPVLVAKPVELPGQPPDRPGRGSAVAVGDGWGCARVFGWEQAHWQCWGGDFVESPAPYVRARPVPWLSAEELPVGPNRLCFLDQRRDLCWPWPDFARARPDNLPEVQKREGRTSTEARDGQLLVGGTFACTIQYAGAEKMLQCSGDDSFGQLAKGEQQEMLEDWRGAVGTWHGCVTPRSGKDAYCWGRGDGGQLGYPPTEKCAVAGRKIACSRSMHKVASPLGHVGKLFGGDMFTCADVFAAQTTKFLCWGASRDGWFGQSACGAGLRKAWPAGKGFVPAPKATCSSMPVEVPGFAAGQLGAKSIGPRGMCGVVDGHIRCVGAIATPSVEVTDVKVSPGIAASACGIADAQVVCWGEGYSPADDPGKVVPIELAATRPDSAVVDFPPPKGTVWPQDRLIHRGCSHPAKPLPICAADATGEPWSSLADRAAQLSGQRVAVRDRLVVGPADRGRTDRLHPMVLGEGEGPLRFFGDRGRFTCNGDESRLCCLAPAFGQLVIATGELLGSRNRGWFLKFPEVCQVPTTK
jgi:hypothetical protein